ncbi:hypothetical protein HJC23_001078 [Cyclotella cryptica]|uniref:Uncharacterized protein n=1 Tax=Cyclotella cryptica TaxID=29204 RepID=A0ABD3QI85_9STRA|eukprot:CCRYP_005038-RA/>CCRYP_005038-RA protein AED:0.04 eAED:0.04 QI:201/1/1/1/0/0/2/309/193
MRYLETHIEPSDVGPFLLIHTFLSAILVGSTWCVCYFGFGLHSKPPYFSHSKEHVTTSLVLNIVAKMPVLSDDFKRRACQAMTSLEEASRNSKLVHYIERRIPSVDATLLCVSYAEAKLGRLILKPITIPSRIWLSWKGVKIWKEITRSDNDHSADGEELGKQLEKRIKNTSPIRASYIDARSDAVFRRHYSG